MRQMTFANAIDDALAQAMAEDPSVVVFGEDVPIIRNNLFIRFGPDRVRSAPISESAFLGAAVAAAMAGLHPVVEIIMVDFLGVAMDALLNHAAKVESFSGGIWRAPFVLRTACGGGYGDGGQHEQSLWGWLAHIPGITVVVPSTPRDAGGLMQAALKHDGPVVFLEHKLLADYLLESLGSGGRKTVSYDVPSAGAFGMVPYRWQPIPFGQASICQKGDDLTIISVGVGVHRALEAAETLRNQDISAEVIDLRSVAPLDVKEVCRSVQRTHRLLIVDEDYEFFGLSGELAAIVLEAGIFCRYGRVCTRTTIPYARDLEDQTLPNVPRIVQAAKALCAQEI